MRRTLAELEAWHGRDALDAEAAPIGRVAATMVSKESGTPRWVVLRTGEHGDDVTPVPVQGAEPTGTAIRFPYRAGTILAAPHLALGGELTSEQDRQLVAFYGLEEPPPPRPQPPGGGPGADPGVVEALRAAHALEREAYNRLQSLISSLEDEELRHDLARHLTETEGHAAAVAGRLEQLEEPPSSLRDVLGVATGMAASVASSAQGADTAQMLRDALDFERRECAAYTDLVTTARSAQDGASAAIAQKIRDDEEAMAETLAAALRRMGVSPRRNSS